MLRGVNGEYHETGVGWQMAGRPVAPSLRSGFRQRAPFGSAQGRLPPAKRLNFDS